MHVGPSGQIALVSPNGAHRFYVWAPSHNGASIAYLCWPNARMYYRARLGLTQPPWAFSWIEGARPW